MLHNVSHLYILVQSRGSAMWSTFHILTLKNEALFCFYSKKWCTFHISLQKTEYFSFLHLKKRHIFYFTPKNGVLFLFHSKKQSTFHVLLQKTEYPELFIPLPLMIPSDCLFHYRFLCHHSQLHAEPVCFHK